MWIETEDICHVCTDMDMIALNYIVYVIKLN